MAKRLSHQLPPEEKTPKHLCLLPHVLQHFPLHWHLLQLVCEEKKVGEWDLGDLQG